MKPLSCIMAQPPVRKETKQTGDEVVKSWDNDELKQQWVNHAMTRKFLNDLQDLRLQKIARAEQLASNATQKDLRLSDIQPLLAASQTLNEIIELIESTK